MSRNAGLTLLELMVVVFILSALALSAVALIDRTDHQLRYEDTGSRLTQLRRAIAGDAEGASLSGYVADMGTLPLGIADLITMPATAEPFGFMIPELGGVSLSAHGLPKGWRGPYVVLPPVRTSSTVHFLDGWGQPWGWELDDDTQTLSVTSHGANGSADPPSPPGPPLENVFDADIAITLAKNDWRVDLSGWSVDLENATGEPESLHLRLSVLVYVYEPVDGPSWSVIDSNDVELEDGAIASVTFPAASEVPLGRHLLVVVDHPDGTAPYVARQIAFAPRALPQVSLVLR